MTQMRSTTRLSKRQAGFRNPDRGVLSISVPLVRLQLYVERAVLQISCSYCTSDVRTSSYVVDELALYVCQH